MGGLFGGGGSDDGGAAKIAQANAEAAAAERAAEQTRWEREQKRIGDEKEAEKQRLLAENKQREDALDAARKEQANAAQANAVTNASNFDNQSIEKARVLAATSGNGLPGFESLKKKKAAVGADGTGFAGQSNNLVAQSGFNNVQTGGRRYV